MCEVMSRSTTIAEGEHQTEHRNGHHMQNRMMHGRSPEKCMPLRTEPVFNEADRTLLFQCPDVRQYIMYLFIGEP